MNIWQRGFSVEDTVVFYIIIYVKYCVINAARGCFQSGNWLCKFVVCACVFSGNQKKKATENCFHFSLCMNSKELSWSNSEHGLKAIYLYILFTVHCRPVNHITQCIWCMNTKFLSLWYNGIWLIFLLIGGFGGQSHRIFLKNFMWLARVVNRCKYQ